mgnify:FL=1
MLVKFLKPYTVFNVGETTDMMRSKAAELKAQGIITDDPKEIRKKTDKSDKPDKTVVPTQKDTTVK